MSCQQVSRLITTTTTTTTSATAATTSKRIATATLVESVVAHAAVRTTSTPEDPYVFTETVSATPPILFNAQKSRGRLNEAQHNKISCNSNNNNNHNKPAAITKPSIVATTAPLAQLNGTTTNVAATATATAAATKALASLAAVGLNNSAIPPPAVAVAVGAATTSNFNNVTQSQKQQMSQSPLQLQSQPKPPAQTSPKRATNVCVVRPQQQKQQQQQQQHQQQLKQQEKLTLAAPPPLYTHTPSLWQTPLILDTAAAAHKQTTTTTLLSPVVSPPTSPASLPSPTNATPPTAAVTAMVAPIVVAGQPLPPSKFHHTTLAQHLQKVECLKKKKSLPLICNNNNIILESLNKTMPLAYNLTQPPPLTVFNTDAAPLPRMSLGTATQKHSAGTAVSAAAVTHETDLNEIPVNVIFRKPSVLTGGVGSASASGPCRLEQTGVKMTQKSKSVKTVSEAMKLGPGPVAPLTPPTPSAPRFVGNLFAEGGAALLSSPESSGLAPALIAKTAQTIPSASLSLPLPPPKTNFNTEQMSSKVANAVGAVAEPKRKTPAVAGGGRKGNKKCAASAKKNMALQTQPQPQPQPQLQPPHLVLAKVAEIELPSPASGAPKQRSKQACKSSVTLKTEAEPQLQDVAYCLQTHWLHGGKDRGLNLANREERIAMRKGLLRRQALQLLSTRSLQEWPIRAARQRLQYVHNLLLKYKDHGNEQSAVGIGNRCLVPACTELTLTMAAHCERHIVNNTTQQIYVSCAAKRLDGSPCQSAVFDMLHTVALCAEHSHLRVALELPILHPQPVVQPQPPLVVQQLAKAAVPAPLPAMANKRGVNTAAPRKRKTNASANPVGRPSKRAKKQLEQSTLAAAQTSAATALPPMSAVLHRKSSTTSLESIASNSHSSGAQQHFTPLPHAILPQLNNNHNPNGSMQQQQQQQQLSILPALAPLSDQNGYTDFSKFDAPQLDTNHLLGSASFKVDEISQIVAQLTAASADVIHNNNNTPYNNNMNYNSNSSSSFPSFNTAFGGATHHQSHLADTTRLLTQDMFGICENSSAYASSEDTGLGGLSESELMGANDADDMALNGAHLLEEHDLVNVFDTLPDDAFNELFQSVQQAECEAMDRALEIADKNLKCLQQTIGGSDSAFLNDFLDVGDDLLANAVSSVMNSPNTSGIDASTLFVDSSGGGNSSSSNSATGAGISNGCTPATTVADIRGLVQT